MYLMQQLWRRRKKKKKKKEKRIAETIMFMHEAKMVRVRCNSIQFVAAFDIPREGSSF